MSDGASSLLPTVRSKSEVRRLKYHGLGKYVSKNYDLYLMFLPTLIYFIVFHYLPMYGVQIAFRDFLPSKGILGSPWVGMKHFLRFFGTYKAKEIILNTVVISFYQIIAGFPMPIILALLLNQLTSSRYRRVVQTVTYAPHFISIMVLVGMMKVFLSPSFGIAGHLARALGATALPYISEPEYFRHIYVWSGVWQNMGYGSVIYFAALSAINPELHEAAIVDGATKVQRIRHIDIPGILPAIIILLILNFGRIMTVGFQKAYLMQDSRNIVKSEIIATYVYKVGLVDGRFSFSAAVGLFNNVVNFILLVTINQISRRLSETSLW
jgi:putative aldouronate transport system permease protein